MHKNCINSKMHKQIDVEIYSLKFLSHKKENSPEFMRFR